MDITHTSARAIPLLPRALRILTTTTTTTSVAATRPGPARARRVPPSFVMERPAVVTRSKAAAAAAAAAALVVVSKSNNNNNNNKRQQQQQQDTVDSNGTMGSCRDEQTVEGSGSTRRRARRPSDTDDEELSSELSSVPSDLSDTGWQQLKRDNPKVKKVVESVALVASPHFRPRAELENMRAGYEGTTLLGKRRRSPIPSTKEGLELGGLGKSVFLVDRELRVESSKRKRIANAPQIEDVEAEVEELGLEDNEEPTVDSKGKKPARYRKRNTIGTSWASLSPPPHWEEMYDLVREMRSRSLAPVDTMGCERLALRVGGQITPQIYRFQTLVSLLLSSQTKDTVTSVAVRKLQTTLPGGLTIPSILSASPQLIDSLITPVGFHNRKTMYLQQTAQVLRDRYNDDIPRSIEELCDLPGVGPKMAHLCMTVAWGETVGIGVDVHVHRITNLWGWTGKKGTNTPEQTRMALETWLPRDRWKEINYLLVGFGQTVCLSRGAKCGECTLAERGLCRAARVPPVAKRGKAVRVKAEVKVEDSSTEVKKEVKKEEDAEQSVILELVPQMEHTDPIVQTGVKLEKQEHAGESVFLKREVKQELGPAYPDIKAERKSEDEGSCSQAKWELKEETDGNVPDMEDILGRALPVSSSSPVSMPARKRGARKF